MSGNYQDWTPVVLTKSIPKTKNEQIKSKNVEIKTVNKTSKDPNILLNSSDANNYDPENISKLVVSSHDLGLSLQQARVAKGFKSQSDLDKACNFPANTTKTYENGTAIVKPNEISVMNRILGVKLPKLKKEKKTDTTL